MGNASLACFWRVILWLRIKGASAVGVCLSNLVGKRAFSRSPLSRPVRKCTLASSHAGVILLGLIPLEHASMTRILSDARDNLRALMLHDFDDFLNHSAYVGIIILLGFFCATVSGVARAPTPHVFYFDSPSC